MPRRQDISQFPDGPDASSPFAVSTPAQEGRKATFWPLTVGRVLAEWKDNPHLLQPYFHLRRDSKDTVYTQVLADPRGLPNIIKDAQRQLFCILLKMALRMFALCTFPAPIDRLAFAVVQSPGVDMLSAAVAAKNKLPSSAETFCESDKLFLLIACMQVEKTNAQFVKTLKDLSQFLLDRISQALARKDRAPALVLRTETTKRLSAAGPPSASVSGDGLKKSATSGRASSSLSRNSRALGTRVLTASRKLNSARSPAKPAGSASTSRRGPPASASTSRGISKPALNRGREHALSNSTLDQQNYAEVQARNQGLGSLAQTTSDASSTAKFTRPTSTFSQAPVAPPTSSECQPKSAQKRPREPKSPRGQQDHTDIGRHPRKRARGWPSPPIPAPDQTRVPPSMSTLDGSSPACAGIHPPPTLETTAASFAETATTSTEREPLFLPDPDSGSDDGCCPIKRESPPSTPTWMTLHRYGGISTRSGGSGNAVGPTYESDDDDWFRSLMDDIFAWPAVVPSGSPRAPDNLVPEGAILPNPDQDASEGIPSTTTTTDCSTHISPPLLSLEHRIPKCHGRVNRVDPDHGCPQAQSRTPESSSTLLTESSLSASDAVSGSRKHFVMTWVKFILEEGLDLEDVIQDMRLSYNQLAAPTHAFGDGG